MTERPAVDKRACLDFWPNQSLGVAANVWQRGAEDAWAQVLYVRVERINGGMETSDLQNRQRKSSRL